MQLSVGDHPGPYDRRSRLVAGLILFGISFGYVEAAVVVYLRAIFTPVQRRLAPDRQPGELFPLIPADRLRAEAPEAAHLTGIEVLREAATLAMLAAVALASTGGKPRWLPALAITFGTWDLAYYAALKWLTGWPASLGTWDVLFLIPVPWASPVLAPVLVSVTIVLCGIVALWRAVSFGRSHWIGLIAGGLLILSSFVWDARALMEGNVPHAFAWPLFSAGELLGLGAFMHGLRASQTRTAL